MKIIFLLLLTCQAWSSVFEYDDFLFVSSNDTIGGTDTGRTFGFESYIKTHGLKIGAVYEGHTYGNTFDIDEMDWWFIYNFPELYTEKDIPRRNDKLRFSIDTTRDVFTYGIGIDIVDELYGEEIQNAWHNLINGEENIIGYEDETYINPLIYIEYYKESTFHKVDNFVYSKLLIGDVIEFDSQAAIVYRKNGLKCWVGVGYEWYSEGTSFVINESNDRLEGIKMVVGCQYHNVIMSVDIHNANAWGTIGFCW